jgi:hypothetical protein
VHQVGDQTKVILERMMGNALVSEVGALMCVILSRAEKENLPYGELVGTTECITPKPMCRTYRGGFNRVQF